MEGSAKRSFLQRQAMWGRKYKKNAGLLLVIGNEEKIKITGIDVAHSNKLTVSDLADCGARLTIFTEKSIKDLEKRRIGEKKEWDL